MKVIPAIDIIDGKCVRLSQGDYGKKKIYRDDPLDVAKEIEDANLEYLHLVDLDGAKEGKVVNWKVIERIAEHTSLKVDFGGGIKQDEEIETLLGLGVEYINVGSVAVKEPEKFKGWLKKFGTDNFILSADVKNEVVHISGWQVTTEIKIFDLIQSFIPDGLRYVTCTDINTDGMLQGPNFGLYKKLRLKFPDIKFVASGGISSLDDLEELHFQKLHGAIVGKAIYEGKIKLEEIKTLSFIN
jgi:phosphoribosylformimino-5-aminoimidazole carboxamide ribotide isomerase